MAIITNTGKRTFRFPVAAGLVDLSPGTHDVPDEVYLRMCDLMNFDAWASELVVAESRRDAPVDGVEEPVTRPARKGKASA